MATISYKIKALNLFPYSDDGEHGFLGGNAIYTELQDGIPVRVINKDGEEVDKDVVCAVTDGTDIVGQWTDPMGVHHTITDSVDWMLSKAFFKECEKGDLGKDRKGFKYTKSERQLQTDTGLVIHVKGVWMPARTKDDEDDIKLLGSIRTNVHKRWRYSK